MTKNKKTSSPFVYSTDPDFVPQDETESVEAYPAAGMQKVKVVLQTKHRAGKAVTMLENLQATDEEMEKIGKQLKVFCGTGGSVKDGEIIIQGDNRDKVLQWLHKNGYAAAKKV